MRIACPALPGFVPRLWRGMPTGWRGRPRLLRCWRLVRPAVSPGRPPLDARARGTPAPRPAWRVGRLRPATEGHGHRLVRWMAPARLMPWPAPPNGLLPRWGDGSPGAPRGTPPPVVQPGRLSPPPPWCVGRRFGRWRAAWDGERVPGRVRRLLPHPPAASRSAHGVWRAMGAAWVPPRGAQRGLGGGAAAEGSPATRRRGQDRDPAERARRWGVVLARARPGQTVAEPARPTRGTPGPDQDAPGPRGARAPGRTGRQTCEPSRPCLGLRPGGAVTVGVDPICVKLRRAGYGSL